MIDCAPFNTGSHPREKAAPNGCSRTLPRLPKGVPVRRYLLVLIILSIGILFDICPSVPRSKEARAEAQQKTSTRRLAIRCGKLFDGKNAGVISDAVILVEGDRITAVGRELKIPAGVELIDLSRETVLPGLIDTHTHLTYHYDTEQNEKPAVTGIYHWMEHP
jgi:hypothetical protein